MRVSVAKQGRCEDTSGTDEKMGMFDRWFGKREAPAGLASYQAAVERGRQPHWYLEGGVADTIDGRFDMIAAVLSMLLLRLEGDAQGAPLAAALAERFVDDMDGQLRQIGIGDVVVGKHIGKMMGMLGGRLGAYRDGLAAGPEAFEAALVRNLYRGQAPEAAALTHVRDRLTAFRRALDDVGYEDIDAGRLP